MTSLDSLPLFHSWPLYDAAMRLGIADAAGVGTLDAPALNRLDALATADVGVWSCDLANDRLTWSGGVHRLFGLPQDEQVTRAFAVSRYLPRSRAAMEHLRAYAIEHRRGFTMDALICRADGEKRWMRLCAVPVISGGKAVRLTGTKRDVTADYDGRGWMQV